LLQVVFSFGMRAVERGQWDVFHAVRKSTERWTTERGRCKINSIGDSVLDCWGSELVDRSQTLVKLLDQGSLFDPYAITSKSTAPIITTSSSGSGGSGVSLLSSGGDEFDFSTDESLPGAMAVVPDVANSTGTGVVSGLGAPPPPHPSIDILSLIQLVPSFVSINPVTDQALQVALVESVSLFVRFWFNCASLQAASEKCRTRSSFPTPKAYREYRSAREAQDRRLVESPATSVAAATLLQLSSSFLLPVLESDALISNRSAAIIVAKLLCEGLVLRHDKALHFPDEMEERIVKGLIRLLQLTMEEPAPSPTDRTSGRRMLDTVLVKIVYTSCVFIFAFHKLTDFFVLLFRLLVASMFLHTTLVDALPLRAPP
jgi:hypothetical protein